VLKKIIEGGLSVTKEAGIPIVGGHTVKAPEPFYGLSITGTVEPDRILTNSSARTGDLLYLTKPLGSGLITTALKNGKATPEMVANAVAVMKELNRSASEAVRAATEHEQSYNCAVTDITGYGLLGHLSEMLLASKKSAEIDYSKVPLMPGTLELAKQNLFPGGSRSNLLNVEPDMLWSGDLEEYEKLILADAQTSGGLLISIRPGLGEKLESELRKKDVNVAKIGNIVERAKWLIKVVKS
jgi:selenide,water dikinase